MKNTLALLALVATSVFAADTPDPMMQNRIRQEGFRNSKVMETAEELMDFVGPRLTGSPNMKRANDWTRDKLTAFGLSNAHNESWGPFGRGWSYEECTVRMTAPDVAQLWALPRAWTPGTNGVISGKPVRVKIETVEDIEKYRGKLAGKIVLNGDVRELKPHEQLQFSRATDKMGEIVMLGGHLDSWHGGTGATDNGAGVVVAMEAVRILKAIGIAPKRTIRIALWSGEEEGLLGSRAYVSEHFASRPEPTAAERDLPATMRRNPGPLTIKPEHAKLSAYFNLDNGTGKVRGVYAQENAAVVPIFEAWLDPLKDLGVTTVTMRNTGGTDHLSFDSVGLPGFQFIQDEIEYGQRTHHTNYDVYERLQREDLMQAVVVMATFVWEAANRPDMLPRKPLSKADLEGTASR